MKIEIRTREIIKPSSPTPENLRYMKLSLLDQLNFSMSTPLLFFYPFKSDNNPIHHATSEKSQHLKSSLSKTLTRFYPLAGKLIDNSFIHCNDYGVQYTEARVDCFMLDLFHRPNNDFLEKLIPVEFNPRERFNGAIIQANFFTCGGLAIGVSLSHKIADAASLGTFLIAWATVALSVEAPPLATAVLPHFVSNTIIPSLEDSLVPASHPSLGMTKCKTRRYVLDASKVSMLKAKAASATVQNPTRIEAVTAFLWKCLMNISRSSSGYTRKSVLVQAINLRKRFMPNLPENYIGNLSGKFFAETMNKDNIKLSDLVVRLREGLDRVSNHVAKGDRAMDVVEILKFAKEFGDMQKREDIDLYSFTSLCGFPFYEVDFGWGKASWAVVTNLVLKNYVVIIDSKDGMGVEALMSLTQEDVVLFEKDEELLEFASINPRVKLGDGKQVTTIESCM